MLLWISHAYISIWFSLVNLPMSFQLHTSQKNQWGRGNYSSPQMCLCDMKKERMSFYLFVTRWHLHCLTISNLRCCALLVVVEMGLVVGKLVHQGSFTFSCAQDWDKCLNQTFFWYYEPFCLWSQCLASDRNWSCRDTAFLCDPLLAAPNCSGSSIVRDSAQRPLYQSGFSRKTGENSSQNLQLQLPHLTSLLILTLFQLTSWEMGDGGNWVTPHT